MIDHWLPDPAAVRAWYDRGDDDGPLPALRETLTDLLPDLRIRSWHTRRCADAYTAHRHPYIDILKPGRLIIALGGNGRGAQAADAVGYLTAHLALTGQWQSGLHRDAFRHVPGRRPLERHDPAPRPGQVRLLIPTSSPGGSLAYRPARGPRLEGAS